MNRTIHSRPTNRPNDPAPVVTPSVKTNGARLLVDCLEARGVNMIAGMPGGAALPLYDALFHSGIRHVLARHEQGAVFMAEGWARATGRPGLCLATSGPGATNLLTGLADAMADSIPLIAVTGQVPTALIGTNAFQEVDIVAMAGTATRAAFQIRDAREIPDVVARAFEIATGGRPGPVLIDVPKDVQFQEVDPDALARPAARDASSPPLDADRVSAMAEALFAAERPVLYVGGGVIHAEASDELRRFAMRQELPVVASLMGLGAFDGTHELFYGMLGMHAARYTNLLLEECDLLLAVGARFDDRAAGKAAEFCPRAKILHIDVDAREIGKLKAVDLALVADARQALRALAQRTAPRGRPLWHARLHELRRDFPLAADNDMHPERSRAIAFLRMLNDELRPADIIATDVGQHQMWAAQWLALRRPRTWLTSGGLGAMGFGLPAAIGAALARAADGARGDRVLCLTGDGSILLNIQELATLRETRAKVKIVLLNNASLGMVRQQQRLFFAERYSSSDLPGAPDFRALCASFGIAAERFEAGRGGAQLCEFLERPGPGLLEVAVHPDEKVFPMVPPGKANKEMTGIQDVV